MEGAGRVGEGGEGGTGVEKKGASARAEAGFGLMGCARGDAQGAGLVHACG